VLSQRARFEDGLAARAMLVGRKLEQHAAILVLVETLAALAKAEALGGDVEGGIGHRLVESLGERDLDGAQAPVLLQEGDALRGAQGLDARAQEQPPGEPESTARARSLALDVAGAQHVSQSSADAREQMDVQP